MKLLGAVVVVCIGTSSAMADRHQVTGASFDSPAGWQAQDAPDHDTLVYKSGNTFAIFVVYTPHAAVAGGLGAAFAGEWKTATSLTPTKTVPKSAARKIGSRSVVEGIADTTMEGSNVTAELILLDAGTQIVPALIYTQSRAMLKTLQPEIDKMLATVQVAEAAPVAPQAAPQAAPAPVATTGPRTLTTITLADLAGSWSTSDQAVTTYVNSSTGAYSSTSATSTQDFYQIKSDGTYTRSFQGLANGHVVREKGSGAITLGADAIVFTEGNRERKRYHFLEFTIDADGTAHWKMLDAQYPVTSPNIGLYAEKWVRVVKK